MIFGENRKNKQREKLGKNEPLRRNKGHPHRNEVLRLRKGLPRRGEVEGPEKAPSGSPRHSPATSR